jgi:signal transduction histidine kinase
MLSEFLLANRTELIDRCRSKAALRTAPGAANDEMEFGIAHFLDQLIRTLEMEQTAEPMESRKISGPSGGVDSVDSEIGKSATLHGRDLLHRGFTVDQVVHDYGDLCQAITGLAFEMRAPIAVEEFRTFNRCLDNGIADAVTAFNQQRDLAVADEHREASNEKLGVLAHELRNQIQTAMLTLGAIKMGAVGVNSATGTVLEKSLVAMSTLVDRSLAEVRMTAEMPVPHRLFPLADFIREVRVSAALAAQVSECELVIAAVDPQLAVKADREMLFSAVGNLLQNAFKFTHHGTRVTLSAYEAADRIRIDVEDHCGGLPPGFQETMFHSFEQGGEDRTGLGLGLSISRRGVEANGGVLSVHDKPGSGCIFTIDLPRHSASESLRE